MRKLQKVMLLLLGVGVLIYGLGLGIAFFEFSDLTYAGAYTLGEVDLQTETLEYQIQTAQEDIYLDIYDSSVDVAVVADETLPEDLLKIEVTYNKAYVSPFLSPAVVVRGEYGMETYQVEEKPNQPILYERVGLYYSFYHIDEVETFFQCKDQILSDLKNKKIGSYRPCTIETVTVHASPANVDRVKY